MAYEQPAVEQADQTLDYTFEDPSLLEEALTHASSAGHRLRSNERMEFLGDAVLGFVVCERLYHLYPDRLEGELTKIKSAAVSRRACAQISDKLNLTELLNLGKGMAHRPELPHSVSAAVLESVIAALYLDGGIEPARAFIHEHVDAFIHEAAESAHQENFKSVLQQYAQKRLPANPTYLLLSESGPDHAKAFKVGVEVDGRRFTPAWANSKKEAEQRAALHALRGLGLAEMDEDETVTLVSQEC